MRFIRAPMHEPLGRLRRIALLAGCPIKEDARLREREQADIPDPDEFFNHMRRSFADLDHRTPGDESLREAGSRALAALVEIALSGHNLPVVASHGNVISAVIRGIDASFGFDHWSALKMPDAIRLAFEDAQLISYQPLTIAL